MGIKQKDGFIMRKTFTKFEDPGHGWVKVPISVIKSLDIQDKITGFSFMTATDVYLEEDCDETLFCEAFYKKHGVYPTIKSTHTNSESRIREYPNFNKQFVDVPLEDGSYVLANLNCVTRLVLIKNVGGFYYFNPCMGGPAYGKAQNKDVLHHITHIFEEGEHYCESCGNTEDFTRSAKEYVTWLTDSKGNHVETIDGGDCVTTDDMTCFKCDSEVAEIPHNGQPFYSKQLRLKAI